MKRKTSKSNTLANKPATVEQLKTLNISNKGKSQSRSTSSTNQSQEESLKQQIKQLQINYKEQAMKTSKNLGETVENTTRYESDPIGNFINLSKKTFTNATFQPLNESLNFIPTPKVCNKHKLNEELKSFYKLLKLKAYFKDNENTQLTTEEQICKPQKKEKWTCNSKGA